MEVQKQGDAKQGRAFKRAVRRVAKKGKEKKYYIIKETIRTTVSISVAARR
jgi:predicted transcriptional regulator